MFNDYLRLIRWDKPIGTLLLLWPTLWALWIASSGIPNLMILFTFVSGVFLTRSAGCVVNDLADSDFDKLVKRTENRPLARQVITRKNAIILAVVLLLIAFVVALIGLKSTTLLWSLPALVILVSYPFFKRFFPLPQVYLGVAFSFGIPMAFVEVTGGVPYIAWLLFMANLFWVVAYDTIYALVDIEDDLKISIKTSAITFGDQVIPIIVLCYSLFVGIMVLIGVLIKAEIIYFFGIAASIAAIVNIYQQIKAKDRDKCFIAFLDNNRVGMFVFFALVLNYC